MGETLGSDLEERRGEERRGEERRGEEEGKGRMKVYREKRKERRREGGKEER